MATEAQRSCQAAAYAAAPLEASVPGNERDAAWRAINTQKAGQHYSGSRDTPTPFCMLSIHKTGDEFYSSGGAIDTGVTMAVVCLSSWDARIYALGIKQ